MAHDVRNKFFICRRELNEKQATSQLQSANTVIRLVEQAQAKLKRLHSQKVYQGQRKAEEQAAEAKRKQEEVGACQTFSSFSYLQAELNFSER